VARGSEYYFSVDNLCRDTYLRSHLDEEGWVPLAIICNFPTVAKSAPCPPAPPACIDVTWTTHTDFMRHVGPINQEGRI
jgi:hypothetical protein